ncbi:MAG TPA: PAS domain S-box protein [Melioribacteraceae bacterium]|nr:PAS domain S-box protein [Melioribacteraceae bacterium]
MLKNLLTVLNISESSEKTDIINRILKETESYRTNLLWRKRIEEVRIHIPKNSIDVVFYYLNADKTKDLQNLEILSRLFERAPIIIITQNNESTFSTEAIRMGCQDILDANKITKESLKNSISFSIERKKREYEFRRSTEQSKLIFSTMGEGIIWTDREDRILFINKRVSDIYGYTEKELIGQIAYNILEHPDDRGLILEKNKSRLKGITDSYEVRGLKKTGETIWVRINGSPVYNTDHIVIGSVGVVSDITEKKEVEEKLKISESHYRRFVEEDLTGDYITTPDGTLLYCNNSLVNILRANSQEELLRRNAFDFYTDKAEREKFLIVLKEKKKLSNIESNLIALDGSEITVIENVIGSFDKKGNLTQIIGYMFDITSRKIFEKQLHDQTYLLANVIKTIPVGLWIIDKDGMIIHGNPEGQRIWAGARFVGVEKFNEYKGWWAETGNLIKAEEWAAARAITKKEISLNEEIEIECFDGTHKIILNSAIPIIKSDGSVLAAIVINMDITDRKKNEKSIKESEKRFRSLVESLNQAYYETDRNGVFKYCNPGLYTLSGYKEMELQNKVSFRIVAKEYRDFVTMKYREWMREKRSEMSLEFQVEKKDGTKFWVEQITHLEFDIKGDFLKANNILRDIDERKKAEEELKKLNRAIEQSSTSVVITDSEGMIEYVNPYFSSLTGYQLNELQGKTPRVLKSGNHNEAFYQSLWKTILEGKTWQGELLNKKKNGETYWANASISPIVDNSGNVTNFVAIEEDITERKKLLKEIIDAKEKAEISDNLKTEFLSQMSHEIRTPLNIIASNAEILKDDFGHIIPTDYDDVFTSIELASQRIIRTISLILNSAEIQTGIYRLNKEEVNINLLLQKLVDEHRLFAKIKNLQLTFNPIKEGLKIHGDEYAITQIFANLIDNGIKYTKEGEIQIEANRNTKGNVYVLVKDSGIGISEEFQKRLFEPFSQEEQGYSRSFDGNGLGLSLVKKYCEYNDATIEVKSKKGMGSTFKVTFQQESDK